MASALDNKSSPYLPVSNSSAQFVRKLDGIINESNRARLYVTVHATEITPTHGYSDKVKLTFKYALNMRVRTEANTFRLNFRAKVQTAQMSLEPSLLKPQNGTDLENLRALCKKVAAEKYFGTLPKGHALAKALFAEIAPAQVAVSAVAAACREAAANTATASGTAPEPSVVPPTELTRADEMLECLRSLPYELLLKVILIRFTMRAFENHKPAY